MYKFELIVICGVPILLLIVSYYEKKIPQERNGIEYRLARGDRERNYRSRLGFRPSRRLSLW